VALTGLMQAASDRDRSATPEARIEDVVIVKTLRLGRRSRMADGLR
jgi:hypothetical protein